MRARRLHVYMKLIHAEIRAISIGPIWLRIKEAADTANADLDPWV
jgi:hypothetical protein